MSRVYGCCWSLPDRLTATGALLVGSLVLVILAGGCADDKTNEDRRTPSQEYLAAKAIRGFVVAFTEGDGEAACRAMTARRRTEVTSRSPQRTCDRAVAAQTLNTPERDLTRLERSRVTKVDLKGTAGRAQIATPGRGSARETHTVQVAKVLGRWRVASDFFPGGMKTGKVPKPPPGPPANPAEERRVSAVFERFRAALKRGDGRTACKLRTAAARRDAVKAAIELAGSRRQAAKEFGKLTCEQISVRLRPPDDKIRKVVIDGPKAQLTLSGGAEYPFRKVRGSWKLES